MQQKNILRDLIFEGDNRACFIERDRILGELKTEMAGYTAPDRYALILSVLLSRVSTPINPHDVFLGRVAEALPDPEMAAPDEELYSSGHMSFDYAKVLRLGLGGILDEMRRTAARKGDPASLSFLQNAEIVANAIRAYAKRYALAAREQGMTRAAEALERVPYEPAYDFYSALQGIWILHMIAGCYVGSRDYAFGRLDRTLLPFYQSALASGQSEEELEELLAAFLLKCNEICGRTTHNYRQKPIPSHSSKQYVNVGGEDPNAVSVAILRAARRNCMPQPQIVVLWKKDGDEAFSREVFLALEDLTDKMNLYHYDLVRESLLRKGIPEEVAGDFTYSACCTLDLHFHTVRREYYVPVPQIFMETVCGGEYETVETLLSAFKGRLLEKMQAFADREALPMEEDWMRRISVLDSLLLPDSAAECRYPYDGGSKYNLLNLFCPGIATLGDSLAALDRLVYREKRFTYGEFVAILQSDFQGAEPLRREILSHPRFGNDTETDRYAVLVGETFLDAVDALRLAENFYAVGSFYSLERDNSWCCDLMATPDGRKCGMPFSENQSPTYGADQRGITALLQSCAKLPFGRTGAGGLNLTFSKNPSADTLRALVSGYFGLGGIHVGISVIDRETLLRAMETPERYRSLTVRLYGFSEYFVSLPEWQQLAILKRTEYSEV